MYSFPNLEPLHCSMSGSNCSFLTCIWISQEAGKVVWYSHLLKNYPQFVWSTQSKTLTLDCKEIKPVNPKRNQSWIFIGRTDAEAEAPILWPHDVKNWLIRKVPGAGQDGRQEEKGMTEKEMVGWYHRLCGHESEQAPGVGDGQRGLACWVRRTRLSDWTGWLTDYPSELGIGIASCRKLFLTLKQSSITLLFTSMARNKHGWKTSKGVPRSSFYWLST